MAATLDGLLKFIDDRVGDARLAAVGHRIVHGGQEHIASELLTPALPETLRALFTLDPLHLPHNLAPIRALSGAGSPGRWMASPSARHD